MGTTIKGQNLRLFMNGICVAASTSCTAHLAADIQDSSTKDSSGDWAEQEVAGFNWDMSVDALVVDTPDASVQRSNNGKLDWVGDTSLLEFEYNSDVYTAIPLAGEAGIDGMSFAGETTVSAEISGANIENSTHLCLFYAEDGTPDGTIDLASDFGGPSGTYIVDPGDWDFSNASIMFFAVKKTFQEYRDDAVLNATLTSDGARTLENLMGLVGNTMTVRFSKADGMNNRHQGSLMMKGTAIISDLQVTAQNRNNSTFTCQLQGVGDLELED